VCLAYAAAVICKRGLKATAGCVSPVSVLCRPACNLHEHTTACIIPPVEPPSLLPCPIAFASPCLRFAPNSISHHVQRSCCSTLQAAPSPPPSKPLLFLSFKQQQRHEKHTEVAAAASIMSINQQQHYQPRQKPHLHMLQSQATAAAAAAAASAAAAATSTNAIKHITSTICRVLQHQAALTSGSSSSSSSSSSTATHLHFFMCTPHTIQTRGVVLKRRRHHTPARAFAVPCL
jgi:hypothetical protein